MWFGTGLSGKLLRHMRRQDSDSLIDCKRTGWRWLAGSFTCLVFATTTTWAQVSDEPALNRCGTAEYERILQQRNPNRIRQINDLNRQIEQLQKDQQLLRQQADEVIYRIPIVVHVIHNTASGEIGGATNVNISDEQIVSQIQVLNEDYRRQPGTNGFNASPIGADAGIEFFLATTDPNGQPTTGITRHYYPQKSSFNVFTDNVLLSQIAYWPSDQYLNIWVTRVDEYLGFTQFPTLADTPTATDTLIGPPGAASEFVDGSIIDYRYFGKQIPNGSVRDATYGLGRTATHEIGHWLGLLHTWGDGNGCLDDYVGDTPPTQGPNKTRQCRETYSNCNGRGQTRDLTEDYMDYSPDGCMNLFTFGQVGRMRAVLQLSPPRARLIQFSTQPPVESETLTINVYPNPARIDPVVDIRLKGAQSFTVDLFDVAGRRVKTISYIDSRSTRVTLSTDQLSTGMYFVRVKTDNETVSKRLLVQ